MEAKRPSRRQRPEYVLLWIKKPANAAGPVHILSAETLARVWRRPGNR